MCLPALCLLSFQLDRTRQAQDLPKIHLSTSTPPLQNNHGSFVILSSKENQKTPFGGRVVLIMCLPALCLLAFQLDHTGQTQDLPKIHLSTSTPPLQNNHGSFVILSSKENQKTPFGGRVVLIMCLPALCLLAFQLDHTGQTQDLPKIHLFQLPPPPLQNNHGSFVILSSKENQKTPFGGRVVLIMCLPALCLLAFQLDHTGQTQLAKDSPLNFHPPLAKDYLHYVSTSTCQRFTSQLPPPPLQNNHGSFVILSSKKKPEKHHLEEG